MSKGKALLIRKRLLPIVRKEKLKKSQSGQSFGVDIKLNICY